MVTMTEGPSSKAALPSPQLPPEGQGRSEALPPPQARETSHPAQLQLNFPRRCRLQGARPTKGSFQLNNV